MSTRKLLRLLKVFFIALIITGATTQSVFAEQSAMINLGKTLLLRIDIASKNEKLCTEKDTIEYVKGMVSSLEGKIHPANTSGSITWKLRLMNGNWSWSNGVGGVWGESEIYIKERQRNHSFGLNEGHDGIGNSQWAATKGTIDTHMMYLYLMLLNLKTLSPDLNELFSTLTDIDHDLYPKVRNQLIIAASNAPKDLLFMYLKGSSHDLLKAITACGLAMQGEKEAARYLDKSLFERLSMSDYREAAIGQLR